VHFFSWNYKQIWSKEIEEDDTVTPFSSVQGAVIPKQAGYLGGGTPSRINLILTHSQYTSLLDYSEGTGYRVNFQSQTTGSLSTTRGLILLSNSSQEF
jgi:hypothetical protein